jgi:RND family efflux transporter MFP subunit
MPLRVPPEPFPLEATMHTPRPFATLALFVATFAGGMPAWAQNAEPPAARVEVARVEQRALAPQAWIPGSVVSRDDARLATSASGRLEFVAEVGTRLKTGELVAKLEDRAARLRLEDARSELVRVKSQRELAQRQSERLLALVASNSIAANQHDEAKASLNQLTAQVSQAEVRVRTAQYEFEQTRILAPFPGIVTERLAQRGEYAATGSAIAHLVDTSNLEVRVLAPLALASSVEPGMSLRVRAGNRSSMEKVRTVISVGDEQSRRFEVRMALGVSEWLVGNAVEVAMPDGTAETALSVPRDALVTRADGTYVVRVRADGSSERISVEPGVRDQAYVAVQGDLAAGDQVVVRGAERLGAGQKVQIAVRSPPPSTIQDASS